MNKRILRVLLLVITAATAVCFFVYFNYERSFSSLAISQSEYNTIKSARREKKDLAETVSFNGYPLFYDETGRCYYYSLIEESRYSHDPGVSWNNKKVKICFDHVQITDEMIHQNERIKMLVYDDRYYGEYDIVCTNLPLINIEVNDEIQKETRTDMKFTLFDNRKGAVHRMISSDGKINVKGHTTASYDKKSFRLRFFQESLGGNTRQNDLSLLGMRRDDDYILYAGYNDQEKIRNVFNCRLWYDVNAGDNSLGIKNGMYYKYVELFMNGEYWGLYALGFPIDAKQMQIDAETIGTELEENLYQKNEWLVEPEEGDETPAAEIDFSNNDPIEKYELKTNKDSAIAWRFLKEYYRTIMTGNDPKEIYDMIDLNSAIDVYLYVSLIQGTDNSLGYQFKNMYLCSKVYNGRLIMVYTPWDMDITWGNYWSYTAKNYTNKYYLDADSYKKPMLMNPVQYLLELNDPQIKGHIRERYTYLRNNGWSNESVLQILNGYEKDIYVSGAYSRDKDRWPKGTFSSEDVELSRFKEYVINRLAYFDTFVKEITE